LARLLKIDELTRPDHGYLRDDDECYYLREYTARGGYEISATNDLIHNLKKEITRRVYPAEYRYKALAINQAARELATSIKPEFLKTATLVPIPPSKIKSDPDYDDRILQVIDVMITGITADVRELIIQTQTLVAYHAGGVRDAVTLAQHYQIDESLANPAPARIAVFDDLLTKGTHFRAAKWVLQQRFPECRGLRLFYCTQSTLVGRCLTSPLAVE